MDEASPFGFSAVLPRPRKHDGQLVVTPQARRMVDLTRHGVRFEVVKLEIYPLREVALLESREYIHK